MADVIHLEGFVAKAPESRAAGNHTITSVTVAVNQGRMKDGQFVPDKDRNGAEIVRWWETEFWNEHGDAVQHTVRKGDLVQIVGEPRPEVYQKNDGTPGLGLRIAGKSISVVVRRPSRNGSQGSQQVAGAPGGQGQPQWGQPATNTPQNTNGNQFGGGFDDEQPF